MLYVPILKCKQGEKDALYSLQDDVKKNILPLLELTPDVIGKGNFAGVHNFWSNRKFIFDISPEYEQELTDREFFTLYDKCNKEHVIPVIKLSDSEEKLTRLINRSFNGAALRLNLEEILDDDFESLFNDFISNIDQTLIDLIIDVKFVEANKINETSFLVKGAINSLGDLKSFRSIIFSSNSFPKSLQNIEKYKLSLLPRIESKLYEKVKPHFEKTGVTPVYSDYAINHWSFFDYIPGMQPPFNIRYSVENGYIVYKGDSTKKGGFKIEKVREGCKLLVSSEYFSGENFSWGDNQILEKANGETIKPGNSTTWRAIGTNHHIKFIVNLISNQL